MKNLKSSIMCALLIIVLGALLTGCSFRYSVGSGTRFLDKDDAKEFNVEKEAVDVVTSIVIYTGAAQVELIESDNYYVAIDYLYWEEEPEYTLEDGKLYFDDRNAFPDSYSINFNLDNKIKIYLPDAAKLKDISIQNASGDVSLAGFVADDMQVTVSYGNFKLKNAAANKADITLSSGSSKVSDFQAGEFNFTNSYGDATFTNINIGEAMLPADVEYEILDISMSSGDVTIDNMNVESIDISNSYGDVTLDKITAKEFDMDLSSGNLEVEDGDLQDIDVNNSYGDVDLELVGAETDYSMNLSTTYGKIKVGNKSYDEHLAQNNEGSRSVNADLSSGDVTVTFK